MTPTSRQRRRLVRAYELLVALATLGVLTRTVMSIRPGHAAVGAVITIAMTLGSAPALIDAFARRPGSPPATDQRAATFTTVVRLGTEPPEIARTSVILAARAGPTVVVTTSPTELVDALGLTDVPVFVASSPEAALFDAARSIRTDAILVVSASAFPLGDACRIAAGQLHDDIGWATGRAPAPNNDRYAPRERESLAERVRAGARDAGATLWEPDATIVRTDLVVAHPVVARRPSGHWLRQLARRGYRGTTLSCALALRAAPADAPVFWPSQMMRTRATAADLAGATASGPPRARALSAGALLRELYAWPLALWALIPLLIGWSGSFPLSCAPLTFVGVVAVTATGRWSATRLTHEIGLHPVHDARSAAYDAPGSLLALPSAISRRIRPRRIFIPDQPLLWAALAFTFATTMLLLERTTTSDAGANIAAGAAVANIVLLWIIALRAVGQRGWDRTVYRLRVDLAVRVDGVPGRLVEASPVGGAIVGGIGAFDNLVIGSTVNLVVAAPDGSELQLRAVVAHRRSEAAHAVVGVSLRLEPTQRLAWVGVLFDAARRTDSDAPPDRATRSNGRIAARVRDGQPRVHTFVFRLQMVLVGTISIFAAGVLVLVLLGFRPLVISSGSMRPTLQIGDVVVTSPVRADTVHVGDIVSFDDRDESTARTTHRVRSVTNVGPNVRIETRGDANSISEIWEVPRRSLVKRTDWRVPYVGGVVTDLGTTPVRAGLLAGCLATCGAFVGTAHRRSRRARRASPLTA